MARQDHQIMISQSVDGEPHYAVLKLRDTKVVQGRSADGTWRHGDNYFDEPGKELFTGDSKEHLQWEWKASDPGGSLSIGSRSTSQSSHKEGEGPYFQVLIFLNDAKRMADDRFKVASSGEEGKGKLIYNVSKPGGGYHFKAGAIEWSVVRYER